jgi:PAS domain S-box-containing protein
VTEAKSSQGRRTPEQALLEAAEQIAQMGSYELVPKTGERRWSDNFFRILGLEPGEIEPTREFFLERIHPDDRPEIERAAAKFERSGETTSPLEYRFVRPDGEMRHLRSMHAVVEGDDGHERVIGPVQDVTDQRRAEREIAARLAVSEAIAIWESLEQGAEALLSGVSRAMDFEAGVLWAPRERVLTPRVFWSSTRTDLSEFEAMTHQIRFPRGSGLPGIAWESTHPIGWRRSDDGVEFDRRAAGELDWGVALPAIHDGDVVAVLEFYSRETGGLNDRLLRSLRGIGRELGTFLARRRAELGSGRSLTPRELEVLQLAANGHSGTAIASRLVISPSTIKTHFNHIYEKLGVSDRAAAVASALRLGLIE